MIFFVGLQHALRFNLHLWVHVSNIVLLPIPHTAKVIVPWKIKYVYTICELSVILILQMDFWIFVGFHPILRFPINVQCCIHWTKKNFKSANNKRSKHWKCSTRSSWKRDWFRILTNCGQFDIFGMEWNRLGFEIFASFDLTSTRDFICSLLYYKRFVSICRSLEEGCYPGTQFFFPFPFFFRTLFIIGKLV